MARRADNCYFSKESAWRKNAVWLRYLAQSTANCSKVARHNQMMAKWQVSDVIAIAYERAEHADIEQDAFEYITLLRRSMGVKSSLKLVQFSRNLGMGWCVVGCCGGAPPEQVRELVARVDPKWKK